MIKTIHHQVDLYQILFWFLFELQILSIFSRAEIYIVNLLISVARFKNFYA